VGLTMTMTKPTSEQVTHEGKLLSSVLGNAPINVKAYGAKGDGVTDDTAAVQAALDAAAGGEIAFSPGTYLVYALKVSGNTTVDLGSATIKRRPAVSGDLGVRDFTGSTVFINTITTASSVPGYAPIFYLIGDNVTFRNGTIDGNRANDTLNTSAPWGGSLANSASRSGILGARSAVPSCNNVTVDGVRFMDMVGTALNFEMDGVVRVSNCVETNAGHVFLGATSDTVTFLTIGKACIVTGNTMDGDRVNSPIPNPAGLDRFKFVLFSGNKVDETQSGPDGGVKFQDSDEVVVSNNSWTDGYIKPQSAPTFKCKSFSITGNTFLCTDPAVKTAGIANMTMRCASLVVSGNSFTNALCQVERSSDLVNISANSFAWTIDPNLSANSGGTIGGGANVGSAGRALISSNSFDGGGFNGVHFFAPPLNGGINVLSGNVVTNADTVIPLTGFVSVSADTAYHIIGNTFLNCRAFGQIHCPSSMYGIVLKNNHFGSSSSLSPNNQQTVRRNLRVVFANSAITVDMISIDGNTWDSSYSPLNSVAMEFAMSNPVTLTNMVVRGNSMLFSEPTTVNCIALTASSATFTNVHIQDNYMLGNFQFSSGSTVTNEHVGMNSFGVVSSVRSSLTNLAQKAVGITGTLSTTVGSAGAASALPATPTGYVTTVIDGTSRKIPYYAS
jgi:hypothetical protein